MCNRDMGLILFHWVKEMPIPSPDFHTMVSHYATRRGHLNHNSLFLLVLTTMTQHQCRDPEAVLKWAEDRAALISHDIQRKGGAKELFDPL